MKKRKGIAIIVVIVSLILIGNFVGMIQKIYSLAKNKICLQTKWTS